MNALSNDSIELQTEDFACDAVVVAMLAVHYGKASSLCPQRGFGSEIENRTIYDPKQDKWYSASTSRLKGRNGVLMVIRTGTPTGRIVDQFWVPFESLGDLKVTWRVCRDLD